jgi:hypothetical protein
VIAGVVGGVTACASALRSRNGIAMWSKRLERGRFRPTFAGDAALSANAVEFAELALVLEGIDLAGARRRPRWQPAPKGNGAGISELAALSQRS